MLAPMLHCSRCACIDPPHPTPCAPCVQMQGDAGFFRLAQCYVHESGALMLDPADCELYDAHLNNRAARVGGQGWGTEPSQASQGQGQCGSQPVLPASQPGRAAAEEDEEGGGGGGGGASSDEEGEGGVAGGASQAPGAAVPAGNATTGNAAALDPVATAPVPPTGQLLDGAGIAGVAPAPAPAPPAPTAEGEGEEEEAGRHDPWKPLDMHAPGTLPLRPMQVCAPGPMQSRVPMLRLNFGAEQMLCKHFRACESVRVPLAVELAEFIVQGPLHVCSCQAGCAAWEAWPTALLPPLPHCAHCHDVPTTPLPLM